MSFRTVVITRHCKCNYKNGYLIIRDENVTMIHLSEIYCLILDTTAVSITSYLINELILQKIPVIICDETHNPNAEILPLYGSYNTTKRVLAQIAWTEKAKQTIWTYIIAEKIRQQALHLQDLKYPTAQKLYAYLEQLEYNDETNREGHAAKVYFNSLFGKDFGRNDENDINAALNYGYAILLSTFNKEITANGYLTQLGLCHKNEFNQYNLACDLMEPFRPLIDRYISKHMPFQFDREVRFDLINLLNSEVDYNGGHYYLSSVIQMYVKEILNKLSNNSDYDIQFCTYV